MDKKSENDAHAVSYRAPVGIIGSLLLGILLIGGGIGSYVLAQHSSAPHAITAHSFAKVEQAIMESEVRLNARIDQTNARLDQTNARIDQTNARLLRIDDKVDEILLRLIQRRADSE